MTSFLNRMQASDISNVCNQVLEEIAQRAANIHPPAGVSQGLNFKIRQRLTTSRCEDYKALVVLAEAIEEDLQEGTKIKATVRVTRTRTRTLELLLYYLSRLQLSAHPFIFQCTGSSWKQREY
nr:hypothetical protein CFP56_39927 [Quercus suber]